MAYGCGFEMNSENDCAPITVAAGASTTMSAAVMSCLLNGSCIGRLLLFLARPFGVPRYGTEVPRLWIEAEMTAVSITQNQACCYVHGSIESEFIATVVSSTSSTAW